MLFRSGLSVTAEADWDIEKQFDVKAGGKLVITTDQGSIRVDSHSLEVVEVLLEVVGFEEDDLRTEFDQNGADVRVDVDVKRHTSWGRRHLKFTVLVPASYNLDLNTSGGSISADNVSGTVDADTSGGSLDFKNIVGDIRAHTSGGSIDAKEIEGSVRVRTSGGSIDIEDVSGEVLADTSGGSVSVVNVGGDLEAETSGGSMRIEDIKGNTEASTSGGSIRARFAQQPAGDVSLATSGGGIKVKLGADVNMSLYARARKIRSEVEVDGRTEAKNRLNGDINDGGPSLELRAHSGSVSLESI